MSSRTRKVVCLTMASAAVSLVTTFATGADPMETKGLPTPAAMVGEQIKTTFTVQEVDATKRTVTLKASDGTLRTVTCGPMVRNFDQIKVGDQVTATLSDAAAVYVGKTGAPPLAEGATLERAPKGAKPGMFASKTEELTAKITGIDAEKRLITFQGPEGNFRSLHVGPAVNLSDLKKGDDVTVQWTRAMAINVHTADATEAVPAAAKAMPGMPEAIMVDRMTGVATIESIDPAARMLTIKGADGTTRTFTVSKDIQGFDQLKTGDQIHVTAIDELAVAVRKSGEPSTGGETMVNLSPRGGKPGMFMANTTETTVKLTGIDYANRMLTLELPSGSDKIIKAAPSVNLDTLKKGDDITVQWTRALLIDVQSPGSHAMPAGEEMKPQ